MEGDRKRQFSGVYVRMVVSFLHERHDAEVLRRVLAFAGEDRPVEVLLDDAVWVSYDQIRRLFEATASMLDGVQPAGLAAGAGGGGSGGPLHFGGGGGPPGIPPMPTGGMILVIVGWIVGRSVIGAWRMATRDA